MSTHIVKIIACCVCISIQVSAEMSLPAIHGMSTCMKPGYELYAPAIGALYWYSPYARNLYEFGDKESAMVKLTKQLFNINVDGSFDISYSALQITRYFDCGTIGQIIGMLNTESNIQEKINGILTRLLEAKKEEIKKSIVEGLTETIGRQTTLIQAKLQQLIESPIAITVYAKNLKEHNAARAMVNKPKKITRQKVQHFLTTIKANSATLKQFNQLIGIREAHLIELSQEKEKTDIVNKYFLANVRDFPLIIQQVVHEESQNLYPQGVAVGLLLAWLWRKSNTVDDIKIYLDNVALTVNKHCSEICAWPLPVEYTRHDYDELKHKPVDQIEAFSLDEFICARFGFDLYENPLPPIVAMSGTVKCHRPGTDEIIHYADCGETSLRNLLNALLYNARTKRFDLALLKQLTSYQPLLNFYAKYNTAEKIATKDAHNDWSDVVSGLPGVIYHDPFDMPRCNIASGIRNMFSVIAQLIPGATSFENLKKILEKQGIDFIYYWSAPLEQDVDNTITINIEKPEQEPFSLSWEFEAGHFQLIYPPFCVQQTVPYKQALSTLISKTSGIYNRWQNIMLLSIFEEEGEALLRRETVSIVRNVPFLISLKTPEQKIRVISSLINGLDSEDPNQLKFYQDLIERIYNTLPDDNAIWGRFIDVIIAHLTQHTVDLLFKLLGADLTDNQKTTRILAIINKEIQESPEQGMFFKQLYGWIQSTLPTLKESDKQQVLYAIVRGKIPTSKEGRVRKGPLYKWASTFLPMVTNDWYKLRIIDAILEQRIPSSSEDFELYEPLYEWMKNALRELAAKVFHYQVCIIIRILRKEIPDLPEGRILLEALYGWLKDILPTLGADRLVPYIELILKHGIPDSSEKVKLLEPLYQGIKKGLPTVTNGTEIMKVIETILRLKNPDAPEKIKLIAPLYEWMQEVLVTLTDDVNKQKAISTITGIEIPNSPDGLRLFLPLYGWIGNTLSTLTGDANKRKTIITILAIEIPDSEEGMRILEPLYRWVEDNLPLLSDGENKLQVMQAIFKHKISGEHEKMKLLAPLYEWVKNALLTIEPKYLDKAIGYTLENSIPASPEGIRLAEPLYQMVAKMMTQLTDELQKISTIANIVIMKIPDVPESRKLLVPFYDWINGVLPTLSDSMKGVVIPGIIKKTIPDSPEAVELLKPLYIWVKKTLPTITLDWVMTESIDAILLKDISNSPEKRELLKILFEGLINSLPGLNANKRVASRLLSAKPNIGDLLTAEQWQQVDQLAKE